MPQTIDRMRLHQLVDALPERDLDTVADSDGARMSWRLKWTRHAAKGVQGLDRQVRERIVEAIEHLAQTEQGDVASLKKS
jgi:hypothetical protein